MDTYNSVERHILMTISPTRADPRVLRAMAVTPPTADDPAFLAAYGGALKNLRTVLGAPSCQPFIFPGTGTLGMEALITNWLEPGARLLVASTGFWGDRFAEVARRFGVAVTHMTVAPGAGPDMAAIEAELASGTYKAFAWTHVDSSTGVRVDCAALATLARRYCALSLVDGVAGAGIEPFYQDACDVDVYLTASPKGLACPSGLVLITAGARALDALERRATPPMGYATDLIEWKPVMQAMEAGRFGYFNTPALNLTMAMHVGLALILEEGLESRWTRHARLANAMRAGLEALELQLIAQPGFRSNALSTVRYPAGVGRELLEACKADGVVLAGGYHPTIGPETFRIGHLGWVTGADVTATIEVLARNLYKLGAVRREQVGEALAAVSAALLGPVHEPALV